MAIDDDTFHRVNRLRVLFRPVTLLSLYQEDETDSWICDTRGTLPSPGRGTRLKRSAHVERCLACEAEGVATPAEPASLPPRQAAFVPWLPNYGGQDGATGCEAVAIRDGSAASLTREFHAHPAF